MPITTIAIPCNYCCHPLLEILLIRLLFHQVEHLVSRDRSRQRISVVLAPDAAARGAPVQTPSSFLTLCTTYRIRTVLRGDTFDLYSTIRGCYNTVENDCISADIVAEVDSSSTIEGTVPVLSPGLDQGFYAMSKGQQWYSILQLNQLVPQTLPYEVLTFVGTL